MNKKKTLEKIGKYCKEWRRSRGLTQGDIAKVANVSVPIICDFENGRNDGYIYLLVYILEGMPVQNILEIWSDIYHGREK